jgi:hypothetical protein
MHEIELALDGSPVRGYIASAHGVILAFRSGAVLSPAPTRVLVQHSALATTLWSLTPRQRLGGSRWLRAEVRTAEKNQVVRMSGRIGLEAPGVMLSPCTLLSILSTSVYILDSLYHVDCISESATDVARPAARTISAQAFNPS